MQKVLINHPKLRIALRTGTEGPLHDPYSYEEYEIIVPDRVIVMHQGLGEWIEIDGTRWQSSSMWVNSNWFDQFLVHYTGFKLDQLLRFHRKSKEHCSAGGQHDQEWFAGYPGESICRCRKCGQYIDYTFNVSAVM